MRSPTVRYAALIRVLDWWRPARELSRQALFQLRCVVAYSLFALVVTLYSAVQSRGGSPLAFTLFGGYAVGTILVLLAGRLGVSPTRVAWMAIFQLGVFLSLVALVSTSTRLDQLFWLVLLPLSARAVFSNEEPAEGAVPSTGGRPMLIATVAALLLGVLVVVAQSQGISFGQPPRDMPNVVKGTEHVLFVATVVGLLWVHELTVRATLEELRLLQSLVTCCSWCRNVREEDGSWVTPDIYLANRNRTPVTHGICPSCFAKATD